MEISGKWVLITGASGGIGKAAAFSLARRGAHLILVARREKELAMVASEIRSLTGASIETVRADITSPEDRIRILETTKRTGLQVLINNAGITAHGRFDGASPTVLRRVMELNFFAMAELTQILLPVLQSSVGTRGIVLVSSPAGLFGLPERSAYSASKAAGHSLMETLRMEFYGKGFFFLTFCPGYTATDLRRAGLNEKGERLQESQAKGAKTPEAVAEQLCRAIEREKRMAFTDGNGRALFWLRRLPAALLEALLRKLHST